MPIPIALTLAYFATNLALMVWLERERAHERAVAGWIGGSAAILRYGPPLAGAIYLVVLTGDWAFVLFVLGFFGIAAYCLNGLLAFPTERSDRSDRTRDDWR